MTQKRIRIENDSACTSLFLLRIIVVKITFTIFTFLNHTGFNIMLLNSGYENANIYIFNEAHTEKLFTTRRRQP